MSDEETIAVDTSDAPILHAEYKDGQLQIVEVTPFDRDKNPGSILPDMITTDGQQQHKYMQVLDPDKGLVQLDLLNLTLVRCEDGEESYRLVTNSEDGSEIPSDATVTCVLQSSDAEEHENQDYVMVDGDQGLVFLEPSSSNVELQSHAEEVPQPAVESRTEKTPRQILDKTLALQRARALVRSGLVRPGRRGRRAAGELPAPHELLASPRFKLYLYSCKMCTYKCNAIKELQAHRAAEHGVGGGSGAGAGAGRFRLAGGARGHHAALQCARCPFRAASHAQLLKHVQAKHVGNEDETSIVNFSNKVSLNCKEVEEADVLVCGACGYESGDRDAFREHIETEHGATTI